MIHPIAPAPHDRRGFLRSLGGGFGSVAFAAMAAAEQALAVSLDPLAPKQPHFPAKAKRVILLWMQGGPSQMDLFDYKPRLKSQAGEKIPFQVNSAKEVFFIVFFNTFQGVREVDPVLVNNARMLGARERDLVKHVLMPSAMAWIFSSLHISVGFAIIAVVVGEYLGSSRGIGYVIAQAEGVFDTTGVFAGMTVLSAVVLLVGAGVNAAEHRLLRWKRQA